MIIKINNDSVSGAPYTFMHTSNSTGHTRATVLHVPRVSEA